VHGGSARVAAEDMMMSSAFPNEDTTKAKGVRVHEANGRVGPSNRKFKRSHGRKRRSERGAE